MIITIQSGVGREAAKASSSEQKTWGGLLLHGGHGQQEGAAWGEIKGKRREARYLLPCLSESKKSPKVESGGGGGVDGNQRKREREKEGRVGEETRASYCN